VADDRLRIPARVARFYENGGLDHEIPVVQNPRQIANISITTYSFAS
jgi:hypothetical protein